MKYKLQFVFLLFLVLKGQVFAQVSRNLSKKEGLTSDKVNSIVNDEMGVWVGTDGGIQQVSIQEEELFVQAGRNTSQPVLSLENSGKYLWVGIQSKGLYLFDKKTYQLKGYLKRELGNLSIIYLKIQDNILQIITDKNEQLNISLKDTSIINRKTDSGLFAQENKQIQKVTFKALTFCPSEKGILIQKNLEESVKQIPLQKLKQKDKLALVQMPAVSTKAKVVVKKEKSYLVAKTQTKAVCYQWYWCVPFFLSINLIVFLILRSSYKKDVLLLEEEILRLKRNKN